MDFVIQKYCGTNLHWGQVYEVMCTHTEYFTNTEHPDRPYTTEKSI